MKKLVFLLQFAAYSFIANAQTPDWLWAESSTGGGFEYGYGVSIDPSNNIFLSGRCAGTMTLGGKTVTAGGDDSPVMGEFDPSGNAIWLKEQTYSSGYDYIFGFCRDNKDNTYGIGTVNSGSAILLEKYNSTGTLQFAKQIYTGTGANGYGVVADNLGNMYITGRVSSGSYTFGTITVTYPGSQTAILLAKLDSTGNFIWAKCIYGTGAGDGADDGRDILTDNKGNIYFCGNYSGAPVFGSTTAPDSTAYSNFYIAKYDTAGNEEQLVTASNASTWSTNFGGVYGAVNGIAMDSCGNFYATGMIQNTAHFGKFSVTSAGGEDIFVAKCSGNGQWQWVSLAGSADNDNGLCIALDKDNDIYIGGEYSAPANFGNGVTLAGYGIFVAKYTNITGQALWAQGAVSNAALLLGLAVDTNKFVYITGSISDTSTFGATNLIPTSTQDIFLAKLDTVSSNSIVAATSSYYCPGSPVTIPYTVTGTFNAGNSFILQLSDSSGSFSSPITLGDTMATGSGTITITIPANTPTGSDYSIRIISTNPAYSSYAICPGFTIGTNLIVSVSPADSTICPGSSVKLKAFGGKTYLWSNGASTDTTTVYPETDTSYIVTISNGGCIAYDTVKILTDTSIVPLTIDPPSPLFCSGLSDTLYVSGGGNGFTWSPSAGLNTTTGDTVVASPTITTTYTVTGMSSGGCAATGIDVVTIIPALPTPVITQDKDTLISSAQNGNQWYRNDTLLTNDTSKDIIVRVKGWYRVDILNPANGCGAESDSVDITSIEGVNQLASYSGQLTVYPNPTGGKVFITINSSAQDVKDWNLKITDVLGGTVFSKSSLNYTNEIDLSDLPGGVYFITVVTKTGREVVPVVRQ